MTTTTRNEAAERLREVLRADSWAEGSVAMGLLDDALTAERVATTVGILDAQEQVATATRRATVERIRAAVERYDVMFDQDFWDGVGDE